MSKLKEYDFYYGAVLSTLLNNGIRPILIESDEDRQIYECTTDDSEFILFTKYRSLPIKTKDATYNSWQFVFSENDLIEINSYLKSTKDFSLCLICGNTPLNQSRYAVLHKDKVENILEQGKTDFTISIKKGERKFRISLGGGRENALKIDTTIIY